jgi:hypothetical protein
MESVVGWCVRGRGLPDKWGARSRERYIFHTPVPAACHVVWTRPLGAWKTAEASHWLGFLFFAAWPRATLAARSWSLLLNFRSVPTSNPFDLWRPDAPAHDESEQQRSAVGGGVQWVAPRPRRHTRMLRRVKLRLVSSSFGRLSDSDD